MTSIVYKVSGFASDYIETRHGKSLAAAPHRLLETLAIWQQRSVDRQALRDMSHQILDDIGVDRIDAQREAAKPFWKP